MSSRASAPPPRGAFLVQLIVVCALGCHQSTPGGTAIHPESDPVVCSVPFEIEITGSEDRWQVRYPGMEEPLVSQGAAMNGLELHVPERTPITLTLKSTDYVYILEFPHLKLKEIAVPRLEFRMEFETEGPGRFELVGDHLCGAEVEDLQGFLVVETRRDLDRWLRRQTPTTGGAG